MPQMQEIDWEAYLRPTGTLAIDPVVHGRLLTNSLYAAQVAKDAIADWFRDRYGERPSVDRVQPDLRINLHVSGDRATVYLDASGQSLHKRGYRRQTGEAPLNEVLAAGILRLTGWDGNAPLVDFLCGSGTLPIEAAMMARNLAPGLLRDDFGYRRWLDFDAALEATVIEEARQAARPANPADAAPRIFGSDLDPAAIAAAARKCRPGRSRGRHSSCRLANFESLEPPAAHGTIVVNPPYDQRLRVAGVGAFYRRLGNVLAPALAGISGLGAGRQSRSGRPIRHRAGRQLSAVQRTDRVPAASDSSWTIGRSARRASRTRPRFTRGRASRRGPVVAGRGAAQPAGADGKALGSLGAAAGDRLLSDL